MTVNDSAARIIESSAMYEEDQSLEFILILWTSTALERAMWCVIDASSIRGSNSKK